MHSSIARLLAGAAIATVAAPVLAQGTDANARIAELEARVSELETRGEDGTAGGPQLTFGSEIQTSVEFYGYLKVDFVYDFGGELGNTTFPLGGIDEDDNGDFFNATAQQTRLGFRTTTPTAAGDLNTRLEIDFYGGSGAFGTANPYEPRVRHAYAELGPVLVGKTWTTFMPILSYPVTLDFQGVAGIPFARQEMVRYTQDFADALQVQLAVERSNGDSDDPVFVAALAYDTDPLLLRASGIYSPEVTTDGLSADDAYGVNLSATASLWQGATIDAAYTYGEGIASYMVFLGDDVDTEGDLIEQQAAYLGLAQEVGEKWIFRGILGYRENDSAGPFDDTENLTSVHVNAVYEVFENTTVGVEYFHGVRETFDGGEYEVDRIQTSFQYEF